MCDPVAAFGGQKLSDDLWLLAKRYPSRIELYGEKPRDGMEPIATLTVKMLEDLSAIIQFLYGPRIRHRDAVLLERLREAEAELAALRMKGLGRAVEMVNTK